MASVIRGDDNFDSANVGPSTTFGAVGTYAFVIDYGAAQNIGSTIAGSTIRPALIYKPGNIETSVASYLAHGSQESTLSGTWRIMSSKNQASSTNSYYFLALRIS